MPQNSSTSQQKSAAKTFFDGASLYVQAALKAVGIVFEEDLEKISFKFDTAVTQIEALNKISMMGVENVVKGYTSAIRDTLSGIMDGVNESAYAAANDLVDLTASLQKSNIDKALTLQESEMDIALRTKQYGKNIANLDAQFTSAVTTVSAETAKEFAQMANGVSILGFGAGDAPGEIADMVAQVAEIGVGINETLVKYAGETELAELEGQQKVKKLQLENVASVAKAWIDAGAEVQKAWLQFSQKLENRMVTNEKAANTMGLDLGLNGKQLDRFKKRMFEVQQSISSNWGKTLEDMYKLQSSYAETTGRNIQMSNKDMNETMANGFLYGDDVIMQMNSGAEIFGMSIAKSNDLMFEMYKQANKMGLNAKAYGKILIQSLKTAEKYQFKDGIRGLAEMAKWAMQTRFNMSSIEPTISSIHEGGLEGLITKSANLQVLGGNFATLSDPLRMGWMSYMDAAGLAKTFNQMIEGIGTLDEHGELKVGIPDMVRLETFAKETGQDIGDVRNQLRQLLRGDLVTQNLNQSINWSDEQKSLITNKAFMNDEGRWVIKMNEPDKNGNWEKDVNELTVKDLKHLYPADNQEELVSYVYDIRDMMTKLAGVKEGAQSKLEDDGYYTWVQEEKKRMLNVTSDFREQYETYLTRFKASMGYATEAQKTFEDMMGKGEKINDAADSIQKAGHNVAVTLDDVNTEFLKMLKKIRDIAVNVELSTFGNLITNKEPKTNKWPAWVTKENTPSTENKKPGPLNSPDINDGYVQQNGIVTSIDNDDQVLAAKNGGPIDRMLNVVQTSSSVFKHNTFTNISDRLLTSIDRMLNVVQTLSSVFKHNTFTNISDRLLTSNESSSYIDKETQIMINDRGISTNNVTNETTSHFPKTNLGIYNEKSGTIYFGNAEQQMMHQYAEATGQDYHQVINNIRENILPQNSLTPNVVPRPIPYDSFVSENPYKISQNDRVNNDKIEIAPIQININGTIQLNGGNNTINLTNELANDPLFIRAVSQMISIEVEKKVTGGRVSKLLNRGLSWL